MAAAPVLHELVQRLQTNVDAGLPDMADAPMKVPASSYADPARYRQEIEQIFLKVPLLVALSCDVREPGEFLAYEWPAGRSSSCEATTGGSAPCSTSAAIGARG